MASLGYGEYVILRNINLIYIQSLIGEICSRKNQRDKELKRNIE